MRNKIVSTIKLLTLIILFNSCNHDYIEYPKPTAKVLRLSKNEVLLPANSVAIVDIISGVGGFTVESNDTKTAKVSLVGQQIYIRPTKIGNVEVLVKDNKTSQESIVNVTIEEINFGEMIFVKGGVYKYGGKNINIESFKIDRNEVTNGQFCEFLNGVNKTLKWGRLPPNLIHKIKKNNGNDIHIYTVREGYNNFPVLKRSWFEANEYALWKEGRLPSATEWEYAAQGGELGPGHGDEVMTEEYLNAHAWYFGYTSRENWSHEVMQKEPNALGIYDMIGNVAEWCQDHEFDINDVPTDGSAYVNTQASWRSRRVMSGGSFSKYYASVKNTIHFSEAKVGGNIVGTMYGFRVAYDN